MKPVLDKMTDEIVNELSGEAREFYDREFAFFNEVTSISGKLKPYIKKTKPEKKVCRQPDRWTAFLSLTHHIGEDRRGDGQNRCRSWRVPS